MGYQANKEKIIRFRLEKPNILTVLTILILILIFINLYYTDTVNLQNKLASVVSRVVGVANERGNQPNQPGGALREVQSSPGFPQQEQPSRINVSIDDDPIKGPENAPVTIIEFSDFQCPFCGRFFEQTLPLIEENYIRTGKVRLVFRDFPLSFNQYAQKAAEASECADEQGKFWEYHAKLFENQNALDIDSLKQYARDLGLDITRFNECLDSGKMTQEVQKDFNDGLQYGVGGTPTFFINGIKLIGAQPYSAFERLIEQELNQ